MIAHGTQAVLDREASDEALVERVRNGDDGAFEDLYRRHSSVAVSVARKMLGSREDAEDAAAEAFTNVLSALRRQVGPRDMFRPYLLACVRNSCVLRIRQRSKQACTRDRGLADVDVPQDDTVIEGTVAAAAFQGLPTRWQSALWLAEVKHLDTTEIAEQLGMNSASASALVYRARQGFSEAYLAQHLRRSGGPACAALGPKFAQYVRGTAGAMAARQIESHVDECPACAAALAELSDVNASLRSIAAPFSMVTAAGATAAAGSAGSASVAMTGFGLGWLAKAAAVAALSASLLVASDTSTPATATSTVTSPRTAVAAPPTLPSRTHPSAHPLAKAVHAHVPVSGPLDQATHHRSAGQLPTTPTSDPLGVAVRPQQEIEGVDVGAALPPTSLPSIGELPALPDVPTLPEVTLPAVTLPAVTLPDLTLPTIVLSLPTVIGLPAITVPSVTIPIPDLPVLSEPTVVTLPVTTVSVPLPSLPTLPGLSLTGT